MSFMKHMDDMEYNITKQLVCRVEQITILKEGASCTSFQGLGACLHQSCDCPFLGPADWDGTYASGLASHAFPQCYF